jgi:hypothetical protein
MASATAAISRSSSNGKESPLRFRRAHAAVRSASSTVVSGHPTQKPGWRSLFAIPRSCPGTPSELGQPRFTSARAAAPCRSLPAKSRIISMQLSTSMCWRMSTNRGCAELPPTSKAKMLSLVLRAERVTGSPMFALQKGAPNLYLNPMPRRWSRRRTSSMRRFSSHCRARLRRAWRSCLPSSSVTSRLIPQSSGRPATA